MADYPVPVKNIAFIYYGCLVSQADTKLFKSAPTLATGDFKVSTDGAAFANLATTPTNTPGTFSIKFSLSTSEMNGDNILVVASDAAGAEWCDQCWNIQTSARGIADLAYPTTSGRSLDVTATGEAGIDWANVGAPTTTLDLSGTTIKTTQKVDVDTIKTNPVVNAGTITFPTASTLASTTNITAGTVTTATNVTTVNGLAANVITATSINADAITAAKIADAAIDAATFAAGAINAAAIATDAITAAKVADGAIDAATFAAGAINAAAIAADAITAAKVADGTIDAATFAAGAIDATAIAADAIGSSELAASAVTEIQAGLSTLDAAGVRTAVGLGSANLDTQLSTIAGYIDTEVAAILAAVDTEVAAIKAKTDLIPGTQDGYTLAQMFVLFAAALLGKSSNGGKTFRSADDAKDRVTSVVDGSQNRTAVTLDAT